MEGRELSISTSIPNRKLFLSLIRSLMLWYAVMALVSWNVDPSSWGYIARFIWLTFAFLTWGYAISEYKKKAASKK